VDRHTQTDMTKNNDLLHHFASSHGKYVYYIKQLLPGSAAEISQFQLKQ